MDARVHIYQNDEDGGTLRSNSFFIEGNYHEFRQEFYRAKFIKITEYAYELWESGDTRLLVKVDGMIK